jgi:uncharacterized protein YbaP (TraB family)
MAEFQDHQQSETELYRREIMNKDGHIELLENNVKELQVQLQNAYKRIDELIVERDGIKVCECPPIVSDMDARG